MSVTTASSSSDEPWVVQFCHSYDAPFLDCARQYAVLFEGSGYKVCTIYLTGTPSQAVVDGSASAEVRFLNFTSRQIRGLKIRATRAFKSAVGGRKVQLCVAHRFKPTSIALRALDKTVPVIGVQHGFGDYNRRSRRCFANRYRSRLSLLGVSNAVRDEMRGNLVDFDPARIQTLYNRLDVAAAHAELMDRPAARAALGLPAEAWVVANVGRLHQDKDQLTLLRGFAAAVPTLGAGCRLAIMGSGPLEQSLRATAAELGIEQQVLFLGQVPHGRRYFAGFDCFALSSDHEPFGMVLLEAMAAGNLLIVTDCGGAPEVVGNVGQLFELGNADQLAAALIQTAALDAAEVSTRQTQMLARLELFSDQAQKAEFWALPAVQDALGRPL